MLPSGEFLLYFIAVLMLAIEAVLEPDNHAILML